MTRILALSLCLMLAACGGQQSNTETVASSNAAVVNHNFDDTDPQVWDARAPQNYPVHGIDLSKYQTSVDWAKARANGVNFVFIKATEGGDQVDPLFRDHWRGAGAAGVARGAYHFFYHCRPAAEQARWFIRQVPRSPGALPPVLDMEWTPTSPTCTIRRDSATIRAEAASFIRIVTAHYGQRPIIYTTIDFFDDNELGRVGGAEFWLRSTAAHPGDLYDGHPWVFWQYTSTGVVPGIAGNVDLNVFAGSSETWGRWRAARAP